MRRKSASIKRREVLKKTGIGVATTGTLVGVGSAKEKQKSEFEGITYNPVTLEELSPISGHIARDAKSLHGTINVSDTTLDVPVSKIPVQLDSPASVERIRNVTSLNKDELSTEFNAFLGGSFEKAGRPLHVKITSQTGGYVSGIIQRPGQAMSGVAFVLAEKSLAQTTSNARGQIRSQLEKRRKER